MTQKGSKKLPDKGLYNEISQLIEQSKASVMAQANSAMTILFWQVGRRINEYVLEYERAEYGKAIVVTLSRLL